MTSSLDFVVLGPTVAVVVVLCMFLWRARRSVHEGGVAIGAGTVLVLWCALAIGLAYRGVFGPGTPQSVPPIGIYMAVVLVLLGLSISLSPSLRGLLTNQTNLIRFHVWRVEGFVFLVLMALGRVPALWALPAGIGDMLVGATAFWAARDVQTAAGRRRAILFNVLGMTDLIVAVALGVTTNPGPTQIFHTTPTSQMLTRFPLAIVPAFLVPLAFTLHGVSLWQLLGLRWTTAPVGEVAASAQTRAGFHLP
jgi:hypothetical protein